MASWPTQFGVSPLATVLADLTGTAALHARAVLHASSHISMMARAARLLSYFAALGLLDLE